MSDMSDIADVIFKKKYHTKALIDLIPFLKLVSEAVALKNVELVDVSCCNRRSNEVVRSDRKRR